MSKTKRARSTRRSTRQAFGMFVLNKHTHFFFFKGGWKVGGRGWGVGVGRWGVGVGRWGLGGGGWGEKTRERERDKAATFSRLFFDDCSMMLWNDGRRRGSSILNSKGVSKQSSAGASRWLGEHGKAKHQ